MQEACALCRKCRRLQSQLIGKLLHLVTGRRAVWHTGAGLDMVVGLNLK